MASNTLEWIMKLGDQFSGPAAKIQRSSSGLSSDMERLRKAAEKSSKATDLEKGLNKMMPTALLSPAKKLGGFAKLVQFVGRNFGGKAAAGLLSFGQKVSDLHEKLAPVLPILGAVAGVAAGVGVALAAAGAAAFLSFAKGVVQAQAFKEDTMTALRTLLKSDAAAKAAFRTAAQTADFIGQSRESVLSQFTTLLGQGFDVSGADRIIRSMADLATFNPSANISSIVNAIGKIKATGRLQGDELNMLNEAGLSTDLVYKQLAKSLGKTIEEIKKMQRAGQLTADVTIQAILAAINEQAGNRAPGAAAHAKAVQNLTGLWQRLQAIPGNVLMDLEVTPGMKALKEFLAGIIGFFDSSSESGKRVVDVLGRIFNSFAKGLFGDSDLLDDSKTGLESILDTLDALEKSGAFEALGTVLRLVLDAMMEIVNQTKKGIALVQVFFAAIGAGLSFFSELGSAAMSFAGELFNAGVLMIDGLIAGITSKAQGVLDAITSTVGGAVAWAKSLLGIHSPSTVFAEIGSYMSQGLAVGAANDNSGPAAIAAMVAPPSVAAAGITARGAGGAGDGLHIEIHELHVHGNSGSPDDIEAAVHRAMVRVVESARSQQAA